MTHNPYELTAIVKATELPPAAAPLAPYAPYVPGPLPEVRTIQLPDGRIVTGYAISPIQEPESAKAPAGPLVSRTAVNIALGGVGFLAVCGGLVLLTSFIAALTALVTQLVILAAVIFGGYVAVQLLGSSRRETSGVTINAKKAVFKRNTFR